MADDKLDLKSRDGLPDALRVLLAEFPRQGWERHPHFAGLVQFWLDRHGMFRQLTEALRSDAEETFAQTYARVGLDPFKVALYEQDKAYAAE